MIKDILSSISGLGIWGTLAILLFFMVFAWWVFSTLMMNDEHVERMGALPIDRDQDKGDN